MVVKVLIDTFLLEKADKIEKLIEKIGKKKAFGPKPMPLFMIS